MIWNGGTVHVSVMSRFESCRLMSILIIFRSIYFFQEGVSKQASLAVYRIMRLLHGAALQG